MARQLWCNDVLAVMRTRRCLRLRDDQRRWLASRGGSGFCLRAVVMTSAAGLAKVVPP